MVKLKLQALRRVADLGRSLKCVSDDAGFVGVALLCPSIWFLFGQRNWAMNGLSDSLELWLEADLWCPIRILDYAQRMVFV